jgi:hypothetical protein
MTYSEVVASAEELEHHDPVLVARTADALRSAAEEDHRAGAPRGRSFVRRLQALTVERSDLGVAVARELGLEHVVEELLGGSPVDGVPGIGPDGAALAPTRRTRARRQGALLLAVSAVLLLVEAVIADGISSILLYLWTVVGLGLFFVGGYLVMLRE